MHKFRSSAPLPKSWWCKQISADVYTAGRLTETRYKYALESGFRAVVSLHRESSTSSTGASSERMQHLAEMVGVNHSYIFPEKEEDREFWDRESWEKVRPVLETAARPLLFHCADSMTSSLLAALYLTHHSPETRLASLGFASPGNGLERLMSEVTQVKVKYPEPEISVPDWHRKYWPVKPVFRNFYVTGQIRKSELSDIRDLGIDVIVNLRKGVTWQGRPGQEEVTLLNVTCYTDTEPGRQEPERLTSSRIFPDVSSDYVSPGSDVNYQSCDPEEFGDDIGYNEEIMKSEIELNLPDVNYVFTPLASKDPMTTETTWDKYQDVWRHLPDNKNVLFVCRTGFRAVAVALLLAGIRNKKSAEWAENKAAELGYHFKEYGRPDVTDLFRKILS